MTGSTVAQAASAPQSDSIAKHLRLLRVSIIVSNSRTWDDAQTRIKPRRGVACRSLSAVRLVGCDNERTLPFGIMNVQYHVKRDSMANFLARRPRNKETSAGRPDSREAAELRSAAARLVGPHIAMPVTLRLPGQHPGRRMRCQACRLDREGSRTALGTARRPCRSRRFRT